MPSTPEGLRRLERLNHGLYGVIVVLVVVLLLLLGLGWKETKDIHATNDRQARILACVADWANGAVARSNVLAPFTARRDAAQNAAFQAQGQLLSDLNIPFNRGKYLADHRVFAAATRAYHQASAAYDKALKQHPLPSAPQFTCPEDA